MNTKKTTITIFGFIFCLSLKAQNNFDLQPKRNFQTTGFYSPSYDDLNQKTSSENNISAAEIPQKIFNMAMYFGTNSKLGFDFLGGRKTIFGFGLSTHLGKGGVGKDYSATVGPNAFPTDIYESFEADRMGLYGILGTRLGKKLVLAGKLGFGTRLKYFNGYDSNQILSPDGYWFTSFDAGTKLLVGIFTQYQVGNWSPYLGADSFNGVNIGVGYNF